MYGEIDQLKHVLFSPKEAILVGHGFCSSSKIPTLLPFITYLFSNH